MNTSKTDGLQLWRLSHKSTAFLLPPTPSCPQPSQSTHSEGSELPGCEGTQAAYGEAHVTRNWKASCQEPAQNGSLLLAAVSVSCPGSRLSRPSQAFRWPQPHGKPWTRTSAKLLLNSRPQKLGRVCHSKPLSFGTIYDATCSIYYTHTLMRIHEVLRGSTTCQSSQSWVQF